MPYEGVECFWVEPNGKALRTLRRYHRGEEPCSADPVRGYHNADCEIGENFDVRWASGDDGGRYVASIDVADYAGDERWPTHCACGYEFTEEDHWQVNQEPIYESADGRRAWTSPAYERQPTPGAMFDTYWRPELRKEDGLAVSAVCPNGAVWCIDDKATGGGHWERTGTVPNLTVSPSIVAGDYHGHLQNGAFTSG